MCSMPMATSKVENSAQVSSCWLKFVHDTSQGILTQVVGSVQLTSSLKYLVL
jgi:hypothetical protein